MIAAPVLSPAEAIDNLDALGSPQGIAEHLAARAHRGSTWFDCCPLVSYLRAETGHQTVLVTSNAWCIKDSGKTLAGFMPRNVKRFVRGFDDGEFPELHV